MEVVFYQIHVYIAASNILTKGPFLQQLVGKQAIWLYI